MSKPILTDLVKEARVVSADLQRSAQDLERVIGEVEIAITSLNLGGGARVYLRRGALAFRPFGEGQGCRLVAEGSNSRTLCLLANARGDLLANGIAAIPSLIAELIRRARERTEETEQQIIQVQVVRDGLPKNDQKSAPK